MIAVVGSRQPEAEAVDGAGDDQMQRTVRDLTDAMAAIDSENMRSEQVQAVFRSPFQPSTRT
jgi:hypothetical protein